MKPDDADVLVTYRLEQARTALDDAKYLLTGSRSPQSIINRSYYAMFYAALALLQRTGKIPSKHTGVISLFDTEFVRNGLLPRELSKDFHRAFEHRQSADYRVVEATSADKAADIYQSSVRFVDLVTSYISNAGDAF